jgi:integrase
MHGFPDRFLHLVQNECPVDIQGKESLEGGIGMGGWAIAQSPIPGTTNHYQLFKSGNMLKHRILLCLIYSVGLRQKEVRNLQQRDIDFDQMQNHIRIVQRLFILNSTERVVENLHIPFSEHQKSIF